MKMIVGPVIMVKPITGEDGIRVAKQLREMKAPNIQEMIDKSNKEFAEWLRKEGYEKWPQFLAFSKTSNWYNAHIWNNCRKKSNRSVIFLCLIIAIQTILMDKENKHRLSD